MPRLLRKQQIDLTRHSTYHVITRCARQQYLLGSCNASRARRKGVFLAQLQKLARFTAIGVGGFSVMDKHLHLLLKVDVELAKSWTAREVAERWLSLHPPRNSSLRVVELEDEHLASFCADPERVASCREKLMSISQFMKELKQETTQQLNKLDNTVGSVWAGRFKCNHVKDEAQLLATLAYIDLNPFAAGVCKLPEEGQHTTLDARLNGDPAKQAACGDGMPPKPRKSATKTLDESRGWWLTIGSDSSGASKQANANTGKPPVLSVAIPGALGSRPLLPGAGLTFDGYLKLLDSTARLLRGSKNRLAADVLPISSRVAATPSRIAAEVRYWIEHGIQWARLGPMRELVGA